MYRSCMMLLLATSCFLVVGCGDSHEKVAKEMISQMKQMVSVMETVKSEEDATAAKPKLEAITKRMKALQERAKKLGDPSPEKEKKLKEMFEKDMKELMPKMVGIMFGMSEEARKVLDSAMQDMPRL